MLRQKDVNSKAAYEIESNALKRDLDNELVLYEFLDVKTQQRFMVNYEQKKELMEQESKKEFEMQIQNYETIIKQIQVRNWGKCSGFVVYFSLMTGPLEFGVYAGVGVRN